MTATEHAPGNHPETPPQDRNDDLAATIERARSLGQRALALRHRGLDAVPAALATLEDLFELDLTDNLLTDIGAPILALTGIEFLTLSRNRLTALADGLWALSALKELDIGNAVSLGPDQRYGTDAVASGNAIDTLPAGLGGLTRLRRLGAGFVGLRALPDEIGALADLLILDLPGNRLETLPAAINDLAGLGSLDLASNPLAALPDGLAGLTGLRTLRLSMVAAPPAVAPLKALERLALPSCGLEALPDWVLALPGLTSLYLAGNPMIDLPDGIAGLSALRYLDLSGTGITEPPRHLELPDGLILRLGPQRLYQDGRQGHAIGSDGGLITFDDALDDDDEETETGPIPSIRPQPSGGLGGAGGVVIHRRAGAPPPATADDTPTRIVRKVDPAPAETDPESQTRRGAPAKGGLAARVQAAVAERDANEQGITQARQGEGDSETGAHPAAPPPASPSAPPPAPPRTEETDVTRASAPKGGGLAARVQAAVEERDAPAAGEPSGGADQSADADKTQMGKRAAARSGATETGGASGEEQEETVSQPRDADGRPIRKPRSD